MIELGADVNLADFRLGAFPELKFNGLTPLMCAVFLRNSTLVNLLVQANAIPDNDFFVHRNLLKIYNSLLSDRRPSFSENENEQPPNKRVKTS